MARTAQPGLKDVERYRISISPMMVVEAFLLQQWFNHPDGRRQGWARKMLQLGLLARNMGYQSRFSDNVLNPQAEQQESYPITITLKRSSDEDMASLKYIDKLPGDRKTMWLRETLIEGICLHGKMPLILEMMKNLEFDPHTNPTTPTSPKLPAQKAVSLIDSSMIAANIAAVGRPEGRTVQKEKTTHPKVISNPIKRKENHGKNPVAHKKDENLSNNHKASQEVKRNVNIDEGQSVKNDDFSSLNANNVQMSTGEINSNSVVSDTAPMKRAELKSLFG